jgi:hypothetical protein
MVVLPDIPDPPPNHRLRTLTVLATAAVLVASVAADSFSGGPVAARPHVFTEARSARRLPQPHAPCVRARVHAACAWRRGAAWAGAERAP